MSFVSLDGLEQLRLLSIKNVNVRIFGPLPLTFQILSVENCQVEEDFTGGTISMGEWWTVSSKIGQTVGFPLTTMEERYVWEAVDRQFRQRFSQDDKEPIVLRG